MWYQPSKYVIAPVIFLNLTDYTEVFKRFESHFNLYSTPMYIQTDKGLIYIWGMNQEVKNFEDSKKNKYRFCDGLVIASSDRIYLENRKDYKEFLMTSWFKIEGDEFSEIKIGHITLKEIHNNEI